MTAITRWKIAAAVAGLCCIALTYRVLDQGITRTYLDASDESSLRHIKLLTGLIRKEWVGLSEAQVMARLNAFIASQPKDSIVLKREPETNSIYLEGLRFEFHDGELTNIM